MCNEEFNTLCCKCKGFVDFDSSGDSVAYNYSGKRMYDCKQCGSLTRAVNTSAALHKRTNSRDPPWLAKAGVGVGSRREKGGWDDSLLGCVWQRVFLSIFVFRILYFINQCSAQGHILIWNTHPTKFNVRELCWPNLLHNTTFKQDSKSGGGLVGWSLICKSYQTKIQGPKG